MQKATEGEWAVVTGAAGGLGSCFADRLAKNGYRLLLLDRREEQLAKLCERITSQYGVATERAVVNLCDPRELESLAQRLSEMTVGLLVNNAGFGTTGYFVDIDASRHSDMIHVHVLAPAMLTHAVLPGMIERDRGAIINVSSLAAWCYSAGSVQYSSTKSYLAVFSQALAQELRGTKVPRPGLVSWIRPHRLSCSREHAGFRHAAGSREPVDDGREGRGLLAPPALPESGDRHSWIQKPCSRAADANAHVSADRPTVDGGPQARGKTPATGASLRPSGPQRYFDLPTRQ